jgi:hypothetical protein
MTNQIDALKLALEELSSIDIYLSDTLSGRVNPEPATYKQWLIDGIIEARKRSRAAITAIKQALAAPVQPVADEPLTCSVCGAETQDPWHFSTPTSRHKHACDKCWYAAQPAPVPPVAINEADIQKWQGDNDVVMSIKAYKQLVKMVSCQPAAQPASCPHGMVDTCCENYGSCNLSASQPAPVQPVASLKEVDVLMMAETHGIDPNTKGLYGFYIDCISNQPEAQPASVQESSNYNEFVETACALIKAADDAAADRDYMLDSDDCIAVLRGTWKAPLANDMPQRPAAQPAPVQGPVCWKHGDEPKSGCAWCDKPPPAAQHDRVREIECVIADLTAECKELRAAQPAVPDAITDNSESPEYRTGWNDYRAAMMEMMK